MLARLWHWCVRMKRSLIAALIVLGCALSAAPAEGSPITCPTVGAYNRQGTFNSAIACFAIGSVTGTPKADDVAAIFGDTWLNEGELTGNGTDDLLTATVTSGSWGTIDTGGTWAINPSFWSAWGRAVVTFHLGNGGGNPDWFFFEVTPGATSGTWFMDRLSGSGGGLSNINLWAANGSFTSLCTDCVTTPESGSMLLVGTGLLGLAALLRRAPKRR